MSATVEEKRRKWKDWKKGGNKEEYLIAKKHAKRIVYLAKKKAEYQRLSEFKEKDVHRIAKQMRRENQDAVGDKCIKDDSGSLTLDDESMCLV